MTSRIQTNFGEDRSNEVGSPERFSTEESSRGIESQVSDERLTTGWIHTSARTETRDIDPDG